MIVSDAFLMYLAVVPALTLLLLLAFVWAYFQLDPQFDKTMAKRIELLSKQLELLDQQIKLLNAKTSRVYIPPDADGYRKQLTNQQ